MNIDSKSVDGRIVTQQWHNIESVDRTVHDKTTHILRQKVPINYNKKKVPWRIHLVFEVLRKRI